MNYSTITPYNTYSPWLDDQDFIENYNKIKNNTLVDIYRCFELWQLVEQSSKLYGNIIEIGVWRGGTGVLMAYQAKRCNIQEKIYLCDTFKGIVKASEKDQSYSGGEHSDTNIDIVKNISNGLNIEILEGIFPEQTGNKIENLKFRLCHIDVDVYQSSKDIVEWIWDKIIIGGIIVYDDYGFKTCNGITEHVNEQIKLKDRIIIYNLNGHALTIKLY